MIERLIDDWLTKCNERGYEVPFTQVLMTEGYRVLHRPVHHPYEHGKDIVALHSDGMLCAFQLKSGDISLADLENIQGQLLALAGTAITYPGIDPPRRPDKIALVTNGTLTAPARDRMAAFNQGNIPKMFATLECVEHEHLLSRFIAAHGRYWPIEPRDLELYLRLCLGDGSGPFPAKEFHKFLFEQFRARRAENAKFERSVAGALLLTSYAAGSWDRAENHIGSIEAWAALGIAILDGAATERAAEDTWKGSIDLVRMAIGAHSHLLLEQVESAADLLGPGIVDGLVYPIRALIVCGYLSAYALSGLCIANSAQLRSRVVAAIDKEVQYIKLSGEWGAPHLFCIAHLLQQDGRVPEARAIVASYLRDVVAANAPRSPAALPDPYHSPEDVALRHLGATVNSPNERFDGRSYTAHLAIGWLARRMERTFLAGMWPEITRLTFVEFQVSEANRLLSYEDSEGRLSMWRAGAPQSWRALLGQASELTESQLPVELWRHLDFLPFLVLLKPFRFVTETEKALDYLAHGTLEVRIDISDAEKPE